MRKIALLCAAATLAACSGSEANKEAEAEKAPESPDAAMVGTYEVTEADGTKMTTQMSADHTYIDAVAGEVTDWGNWELKDGKTCFTPQTEGAKQTCYTDGEPDAEGAFTATPDEGDPITVKKLS